MSKHSLMLLALCLSALSIDVAVGQDVGKIVKELQRVSEEHAKQIKSRDTRIAELEKSVKAARDDAAARAKRIDELQGALTKAEGQAKELKGALDAARGALVNKDKEIANKVNEVANKTKEVADLRRELAAVSSKAVAPAKKTNAFVGLSHAAADGGAEVVGLYPEGPAARGGLKEGDVIVSVAGAAITSENLESTIRSHEPGKKVAIELLRGDDKVKVEVTLGDREKYLAGLAPKGETGDKDPKEDPKVDPKPQPKGKAHFGILVRETDDKALILEEVEQGHTAAAAKVQVGDALVAINGKKVGTLEDLKAAFGPIKAGDTVAIEFARGKETIKSQVVAGGADGGAKLVSSESSRSYDGEPAYLGVKVKEDGGALLVELVRPETAAAAFGLETNDVFKSVNGKDVKNLDDLRAQLAGKVSGDKLDVVVARGKSTVRIDGMRLGAKGEPVKTPDGFKAVVEAPKEKGWLGLQAQELVGGGVIIGDIDDGGPAAVAKIQKEDEVLKVNGKDVKTIDDIVAALEGTWAGSKIPVVLRRAGKEMTVEVTLKPAPKS